MHSHKITIGTVALALCCSWTLLAQAQSSQWPISSVTVYRQGAEVQRTGLVQLDAAGQANVRIQGLAQQINSDMLRVSLEPGWSLMGRSFSVVPDANAVSEADAAQAELERTIQQNRQTFALRQALLSTYQEELAMVQANRKVSGNELLLVEDLRDHADFWRERVKELQYLMLELNMEMEALDEELVRLRSEFEEWEAKRTSVQGELALRFAGPANAAAKVEVSYLALQAGWSATYDAEVDENGGISMQRYASVSQWTTNEWAGIPLTFMVGNPLQTIAPQTPVKKQLSISWGNATQSYEWSSAQANAFDDTEQSALLRGNVVPSGTLDRYSFTPTAYAPIAGTGAVERVFLGNFALEGDLDYFMIPELTDEAYQLANSGDWMSAQLVPGQVQVMANGAFRGAFWMHLPAPGDTLQIPLGQDSRVRASRTRLMEQCSSSMFGGSRKTVQTFEIRVENLHSRTIHAQVLEAIPVSNSTDIIVTPLGLSGGFWDEVEGELTWELDLAPNEKRVLTFGYEITYPKKRVLNGL